MKKLLILFTVIFLLTPLCSAAAKTLSDGDISIAAPYAALMEKTTGELLYEKGAHEKASPASVTKVMTILLIVEEIDKGALSEDDVITCSDHAAGMGGSQIYLKAGEQMSVRDMLKGVVVVSGNDAAVALAEQIAGSEEAFVGRMNARAAELGMEDTHFTNCTGLFDDPDHYTTAYDIALMSRELISHDMIKGYTRIWVDSLRDGEFSLANTNKLIYHYEGSTGLKTGFTSNAMHCLSATAERDGVEYIAVILHGDSSAGRFEDAKTLLNYAFANYALISMKSPSAIPPVPILLGEVNSVQPVYSGSSATLVTKNESAGLEYSTELCESVPAPVHAGQQLGTLTVKNSSGDVIASTALTASSDVARLTTSGIFIRILKSLS